MAHYLVEVAYTGEAWAAHVGSPQNRIEAIRPVIGRLGGRVERAYYAFGEYDVVGIMEIPNHVSAAAFAASAGGAVKGIKTTPLLTIEDGIAAMRKAAGDRPSGRLTRPNGALSDGAQWAPLGPTMGGAARPDGRTPKRAQNRRPMVCTGAGRAVRPRHSGLMRSAGG